MQEKTRVEHLYNMGTIDAQIHSANKDLTKRNNELQIQVSGNLGNNVRAEGN